MLRFKIVPHVEMLTPKEVNMAASSMTVEAWHGPLCYEKSKVFAKETFPMSEEGRSDMKAWLEAQVYMKRQAEMQILCLPYCSYL